MTGPLITLPSGDWEDTQSMDVEKGYGKAEMTKKLILFTMALATMAAFALPSAASATELRMSSSTGELIPAGTDITVMANNSSLRLVTTETALGELECGAIMLNSVVVNNSEHWVLADGLPFSTASNCHFQPSGEVATLGSIEIWDFESGTTGQGHFKLGYEAKIPGGASCRFETPGWAAFLFESGSSILSVTPSQMESAACGEATLEGKVALETGLGSGAVVLI